MLSSIGNVRLIKMRLFTMFITAVYVLFLICNLVPVFGTVFGTMFAPPRVWRKDLEKASWFPK